MPKVFLDKKGLTQRINTAFKESGLSQTDFAGEADCSVSTAGRWLSGETKNISKAQRKKIASALGVHFYWLETGKGPMKGSDPAKTEEPTEYYRAEIDMIDADPGLFRFLMDMEMFKDKAIGIIKDPSLTEKDRTILFKKIKKSIQKKAQWLGQ